MTDRPIEIRYKGKLLRVGEIGERIKLLPRNLRRGALRTVADFMVERFKMYPPYKWVTRKSAYPEVSGFFSDKQRRFVMAKLRSGEFDPGYPHRTGNLQRAWRVEQVGNDIKSISIVNDAPAAVFAYSPEYQARQLGAVGWKTIDNMQRENQNDAFDELIKWMGENLPREFDNVMLGE